MSVTVTAAGVDTWSPAWYLDPDSLAGVELSERARVPTARGRLLADGDGRPLDVLGHRVVWSQASGLLFAEGHPGDGLHLPGGDGVGLVPALDALTAGLLAADVPVPPGLAREEWVQRDEDVAVPYRFGRTVLGPAGSRVGFAGVRRIDTTVDLATGSTAEGIAILAGVSAIAAQPGGNSKGEVVFGLDGRPETVYMRGRSGRKVLGRWYDKGVESGSAPRGRLIRPEDQRRFPKASRRSAVELTAEYVRGKFHQRFVPLWRASMGVTVAGPVVLAEKLLDAIDAGTIGARDAEAVAGHLLLTQASGRRVGAGVSRATMYRREAAMKKLGLVVAEGAMQEVEIDLHEVLERALDAPAWSGPQG